MALRRGPPLGARRRRPARALAESDDQAAVRQSIDELQQLGAAPAAAIVARRLRERGVRGVRADRVHARVRTRPARPASPPASSRCWRCSPRGCATSRSHSAWSCPKRRSTTPSPRRCESSMCAAVLSAAEALRLGLTPRGGRQSKTTSLPDPSRSAPTAWPHVGEPTILGPAHASARREQTTVWTCPAIALLPNSAHSQTRSRARPAGLEPATPRSGGAPVTRPVRREAGRAFRR